MIPKDSKLLKDKIQEAEASIKNKAPQRGKVKINKKNGLSPHPNSYLLPG